MELFSNIPFLLTPPAGRESGGGAVTLVTFGLVFVVFYFLIIRPQSRKQKKTKDMLAKIAKGDKVITIGGIRGLVKSLNSDSIVIKVSGESTLELNRSAIGSVISGSAASPPAAPKKQTSEKS